jgi:glycosyltransferase involved in cell wall biosynthesis
VLGKSGPPVVAVFLSGDEALSRAMAVQMRELVRDHPHVIIGTAPVDRAAYAYSEEVMETDPGRPLACWLELRRRLGKRWIALAPFVWQGGNALRWMPWLLAPRKLLAFNRQLERHHLRLAAPIASWRFLRGEAVGDIFRPTELAGLQKIMALAGFPLLLACWAAAQTRRRKAAPLAAREHAEAGVTALPADGLTGERLDQAVAESRVDKVLVGAAEWAPRLEAALEDRNVWLAYVGRKLCGDAKSGESGTWVLRGPAAAMMFRRDVYLALGGLARLEQSYPGAAWPALSLLGWQRGQRTVFAGEANALAHGGIPWERLVLGAVSDLRLAARVLWRWAPEWRRWRRALAAVGVAATPVPGAALDRSFLPMLDPGVHVFRGRRRRAARRRVAVVSPYLPYPLSHGGAIRIFNLLRAAAEDAEIYLFAFAERETGDEVEPLLEFCAQVILVETPRWERPSIVRRLPSGVGKFESDAMQAAIATVARDEQIPILQIEYTQLAHLRSVAQSAPVKTILVEHDVTFDLHRQLRERERGWAKLAARVEEARWRRYELGHARSFDRVVTMSHEDLWRLREAGIGEERLAVIENGVDLERFRPSPAPERPPEILFIGSFRHFPNVMAFRFLLGEVWPKLRQWRSEIKLTVVAGADHRYYWRLHTRAEPAAQPPEVELLDFVEDVRPLYARATVAVAPLLVSAGTNIKVLEALAMGRALVSTAVGAAGLGLTAGENVILADSADAFAAAILGLLSNHEAREEMAARGRAFVEANYDWRTLGRKLLRLWEELEVAGADAEPAVPAERGE